MSIFDRGDYRAFLVVTPANDLDRALFAFPIFEGEKASEVFKYYRYLYFPDLARVSMRDNDMDRLEDLGLVHADVDVMGDKFKIATCHPGKALWKPVVQQWEDQWVFDHLVATTGQMPQPHPRVFRGGQEIQNKVAETFSECVRRYTLILFTAFAALIVMSSSRNTDN